MRTIESRVPIASSANIGISMVVDLRGRVKEKILLYSRGVIDENIMIGMQPSFYVRTEDIFILLISIVGVTGIFWGIPDKKADIRIECLLYLIFTKVYFFPKCFYYKFHIYVFAKSS